MILEDHIICWDHVWKKDHQIEDDENDNLKAEIKNNNEKQPLEWEIEMLRQQIEEQENNEDMT